MTSRLAEVWAGRRPVLGAALTPLSWLYAAGEAAHRGAYRAGLAKQERVTAPVVCVGNLVAGGAGKTPVSAELARRFAASGRQIGILSRGYRRLDEAKVVVVSDGSGVIGATWEDGGDEPVWLAAEVAAARVVVAARRIEAARTAVELGADLLVLDDGLSHHALGHDAEVVVVDATYGLGNGKRLPAGPIRLPASAVAADALVWLTRCERGDEAPPDALRGRPVVRSTWKATALREIGSGVASSVEALRGARVFGFCGVARPEGFEATLEATGADVAGVLAFPDHHAFTTADLASIRTDARASGATLVVTTEKDAVRLARLDFDPAWRALRMTLEVIGDASAVEALVRRFAPQIA